jgi:hypothetical protein
MYQGLLTDPKDRAALESRANLGGLLSAAGALAQGMSPQGYRRSPLQNVLSALGAGFQGAGQTYESGINQIANVQKLQQSQAQMQAINQLLQDPRVASDPMMVAYIRANPAEAIKYFAEMAPLQQAVAGTTPAPAARPVTTTNAPANLMDAWKAAESSGNYGNVANLLKGLTTTDLRNFGASPADIAYITSRPQIAGMFPTATPTGGSPSLNNVLSMIGK